MILSVLHYRLKILKHLKKLFKLKLNSFGHNAVRSDD